MKITQYAIKKEADGLVGSRFAYEDSIWGICFTPHESEAKKFDSQTEASLFAIRNGLTGVNVIPVCGEYVSGREG